MTAPTLSTARLVLRPVAAADADALHRIFTEPGVRQFLFDDRTLEPAETAQLVAGWIGQDAWAVVAEGRLIGAVALMPMSPTVAAFQPTLADGREFTIAMAESAWGQGLACQVGQAVLRHGFGSLGLGRVVAVADVPNARSHRLLKRLGFEPRDRSDGPRYALQGYEHMSNNLT